MTTTRPAPARPASTGRPGRPGWLLPAGLLLLSAVPVIAGAMRVTELSTGAEVTAANARFFASPVPVIVHVIGATTYTVLGAFQFARGFRRRNRRWHRVAGRLLVPCGIAAALSGVWMTELYDLPADTELLRLLRHLFGWGMAGALVAGVVAVRRRDLTAHGAWMTRAYAIGIGAGTQALLIGPWAAVAGDPDPVARALLMGAGWTLNLVIAERAIRRRPRRPRPGGPALPAAAAPAGATSPRR